MTIDWAVLSDLSHFWQWREHAEWSGGLTKSGNQMTSTLPKRRWFQFRLRTLLIAILVLSLPLSWFAMRMEKARRQREAVVAIRWLEGTAYYEWEFKSGGTQPSSTWWRNVLGHDYFDKVVLVRFANAPDW